MTDNQSPPDTKVAPHSALDMESALAMLSAAKTVLLQQHAAFSEASPGMTRTTLERVQLLSDPAVSPARVRAATELTHEIEALDRPWGPLLISVADVLLAFQNASLRGLTDAIRSADARSPQKPDTTHPHPVATERDALQAWRESQKRFDELAARSQAIVDTIKILDLSVAFAAAELAETIEQAAGLMPDRLNLLVGFLNRTDPQSTVEAETSRSYVARRLIAAGLNEGLVVGAEELLKAAITEGMKVGAEWATLGASLFLNIGLKMREERKAIEERREHYDQLAKVRLGPGPTDDMSVLIDSFQQDELRISKFGDLIDELTMRLQPGFG